MPSTEVPDDPWEDVRSCVEELEWFVSRKKDLAQDTEKGDSTWADVLEADLESLREALDRARALRLDEPPVSLLSDSVLAAVGIHAQTVSLHRELARHLRICTVCAETDVTRCGDGWALWHVLMPEEDA